MKRLLIFSMTVVLGLAWVGTARAQNGWLSQGNNAFQKGNDRLAIRYYNYALAQAYNNRAMAYMSLKRYDQAMADCNRAIQLHPTNGTYYRCRAHVYKRLGQRQRAREDLSRAKRLGGR